MSSEAAARMSQHRRTMRANGFKLLQTHVPLDVDAFLETERDLRRVRSKGDVLTALVAELKQFRQRQEEG